MVFTKKIIVRVAVTTCIFLLSSLVAGTEEGGSENPFDLELTFIDRLEENGMRDWVNAHVENLKKKYPDRKLELNYVEARYAPSTVGRLSLLEKIVPENPYYFDAQFYVVMTTDSVTKKYRILNTLSPFIRNDSKKQRLYLGALFTPDKRHPAYDKGINDAKETWEEDKGVLTHPRTGLSIEVKKDISQYLKKGVWCGTVDIDKINWVAGYNDQMQSLLLRHLAEKPVIIDN